MYIYNILYTFCNDNIDFIVFFFFCLDGNCEAFERHHRADNAFSFTRGE